MPLHPLNNLEIQKYCQNEPKFLMVFIQEIVYLKYRMEHM